jgi:hypothetical protein
MVQAEGEKWLIGTSKCRRQPARAAAVSSEICSQSNGLRPQPTSCAFSVVLRAEAVSAWSDRVAKRQTPLTDVVGRLCAEPASPQANRLVGLKTKDK